MQTTTPQDRTLYVRHQEMRKMIERWGSNNGPSAVVEHGANPGMVSHLVKQALVDITTALLKDGKAGSRSAALQAALEAEQFNVLAQLTGTKVIHIAERDTQITNKPKEVNEFCNTWSVEGFYEEGIAPAELGWGTHEKWMPKNAHEQLGTKRTKPRHGYSPWRVVHHVQTPHGKKCRRHRRIPTNRALRLPPIRCCN
jgi:homospermidine synthase